MQAWGDVCVYENICKTRDQWLFLSPAAPTTLTDKIIVRDDIVSDGGVCACIWCPSQGGRVMVWYLYSAVRVCVCVCI